MTSGNPDDPIVADPLVRDETQPMTPAARLVPVLMAVLCLLLVLTPIAAAPFARSAARVSAGLLSVDGVDVAGGKDETQSDPDEAQSLTKMPDLGVRKLPLLSPETEAEIGQTPDPAVVEAKIQQLADDIGLSISELESAQVADWKRHTSQLSEAVAVAIPAETVASNEVELTDLASLLAIAHGNWSWGPTRRTAGMASEASTLAIQLAKRGADLLEGCSVSLNYAYLSALPILPTEDDKEQITDRFLAAANACGDDPTALFALGMVQVAWPQQVRCAVHPIELLTEIDFYPARQTFERLVDEFPESPTGFVGLAEIESSIAGNNDFFVARPFTARQAWQDAVQYLSEAQRLTDGGSVALLRAQAMCKAGDCDQAALIIDEMTAAERQRPHWATIAGEVYFGAKRYSDIAALPTPNTPYVYQSDLDSREVIPKADAHFAWRQTTWGLDSVAVGFNQCGGPWTQDLGFLSNQDSSSLGQEPLVRLQDDVRILLASDDALDQICRTGSGCMRAVAVLRSAGETERAERLAQTGITATNGAGEHANLAYDELGLVLLQAEKYSEAAKAFRLAIDSAPRTRNPVSYNVSVPKITLRYGYALQNAGEVSAAEEVFTSMIDHPQGGTVNGMDVPPESTAYYAQLQLGELYMGQERDDEALASLLAAEDAVIAATQTLPGYPDKGVAANNTAQVAMRLGQTDLALEQARAAVELDPASPIFLQTLADAERHLTGGAVPESASPEAGESDAACALEGTIAAHQTALAADDSSPMGWNNLGVVQAACGRTDDAADSFRSAIQSNPDYALAWFNYGSLLLIDGQWSDFMTAEGALGIAGSLDRSFRSQGPALIADDDIYDTGLDLSQGLPDGWELGEHERHSVVPITIALIVVTVARVVFALLKNEASGRFAEFAMTGSIAKLVHLALPPFVGVGLSTVLLVLLSPAESKERVVLIPVALAAALLPGIMRSLWAPRTQEQTPATAVLVSALLVPVGITLPPLSGAASRQKAFAAPLTIGALAAVAGIVAGFASVPLERATLMALVAVLTTTLLPLSPYDGSQLSGWPSRLATLAMGVLTALFVVNWL